MVADQKGWALGAGQRHLDVQNASEHCILYATGIADTAAPYRWEPDASPLQ